MIVGGQTEVRAQLPSTFIDYHEPFDQGFKVCGPGQITPKCRVFSSFLNCESPNTLNGKFILSFNEPDRNQARALSTEQRELMQSMANYVLN